MARFVVGHNPDGGDWCLMRIDQDNTLVTWWPTTSQALSIADEIYRQSSITPYRERIDKLVEEIGRLERSNAALRGVLKARRR